MKKRYKFIQVGAHMLVLLGESLASIQFEIIQILENELGKRTMIESLMERIAIEPSPLFKKNLSKINKELNGIDSKLEHINKHILSINENVLKEIGILKTIKLLDKDIIKNFIKERLKSFPNDEVGIKLYNENLKLKISNQFKDVLESINEIVNYLKEIEKFDEIENLDKKFKAEIRESISIYSIGYGRTAVLCVGRTIEMVVNDYLKILAKIKKIPRKKYLELVNGKDDKEPKYLIKIGFLNGNKYINEEEFTKLRAYSFDRNKGGHPNLGGIDNLRAKTLISQGIWLIIDLQKKIKKINKKLIKKKTK